MKVGFVVPILSDCDIKKKFESIVSACKDSEVDYEVIFAFNDKLNSMFSKARSMFVENKKVKAFQVNKVVNEHKLITIAMRDCEEYDATIIYSGKEDVNIDVVKAFITSWKAGNKVVYLKKIKSGIKRLFSAIKNGFYLLGTKLLGVYKDIGAETDIQLFDQDVVITINQIPEKNRHLRTLDSFIGYNTDTIKMEVDAKLKESKPYIDKNKKYKLSNFLTWMFLALSLSLLSLGIVKLCLNWDFRFVYDMLIWGCAVIFAMFSLVYFTKKNLQLRVGDSEDMGDIEELVNKMEKYNF